MRRQYPSHIPYDAWAVVADHFNRQVAPRWPAANWLNGGPGLDDNS
jgi:hypothetical protein